MTLMNSNTSGSGSTIPATEDDIVANSICTYTNPTPGTLQLDARLSEFDGEASGGLIGDHTYLVNTLREFFEFTTPGTVVPLTAGANVTYDASADMFKKNVTGSSWNSWFQSTNVLFDTSTEDACVTWLIEADFDADGETGAQGTIREMAGLSSNPSANASYSSGEFMLYQVNATTVYVYEKGSNKGSFARPMTVGDRLGIMVESGVVTYIHVGITGNVTKIFQSEGKAAGGYYFKAALNRGTDISGTSAVGDVQVHNTTVSQSVSTKILGGAAEAIHDSDVERLATVGLEVNPGSVYGLLTCTMQSSARYSASRSYSITHGYSVSTAQTVLTAPGV